MTVWIGWDRERLLRLIAGIGKGGAFRLPARAFDSTPASRLFVSLRPRQRLPVLSGVMRSVTLNLPLRLFGGLVDRIRSAVDGVVCAFSSSVDGVAGAFRNIVDGVTGSLGGTIDLSAKFFCRSRFAAAGGQQRERCESDGYADQHDVPLALESRGPQEEAQVRRGRLAGGARVSVSHLGTR